MRKTIGTLIMVGIAGAGLSAPLAAQSGPPIQGTMALEGTMTKFYRGLNALVVTTADGAEHVYHFTKRLVVHGGKGAGTDALEELKPGTAVLVHYRIDTRGEAVEEIDSLDGDGLKIVEGVVTHLDRRRRQITLKLPDGTIDTLRLTNLAAEEADDIGDAGTITVTVYYSTESGHRVAHYFKKTP
jgi:hypothetical protein